MCRCALLSEGARKCAYKCGSLGCCVNCVRYGGRGFGDGRYDARGPVCDDCHGDLHARDAIRDLNGSCGCTYGSSGNSRHA